MVDRSFGFETAVQECTNAINSALVEAMSCEYGVGIVKLMGREAGFIAAYATLASHDVDLCLIPEVDVDLYDDQYGILPYIRRCLVRQHHCVVVTSEGIEIPGLEGDGSTDASGNKRFPDVGLYLKKLVIDYFANEETNPDGMNVSVKYIDPSFTYSNFSLEEQAKVLSAGRSNNELDTTKLVTKCRELGLEVPPIQESIVRVFERMRVNLGLKENWDVCWETIEKRFVASWEEKDL